MVESSFHTLAWSASSPGFSALVTVVNGWQNISETNAAKPAGVRIDYTVSARTTISYYNYIGDEAPDSVTYRQLRFFHGARNSADSAARRPSFRGT